MHGPHHSERVKVLQLIRERAAYKDMALKMQTALQVIASGSGDAKEIATQTLDEFNKECGNGSSQAGAA